MKMPERCVLVRAAESGKHSAPSSAPISELLMLPRLLLQGLEASPPDRRDPPLAPGSHEGLPQVGGNGARPHEGERRDRAEVAPDDQLLCPGHAALGRAATDEDRGIEVQTANPAEQVRARRSQDQDLGAAVGHVGYGDEMAPVARGSLDLPNGRPLVSG